MKVKDAVGVSIILHGLLILSVIFSLNFSSSQVELKAAGGDSYYVDYITISGGGTKSAAIKNNDVKGSLKTLTTPNNKSSLAKLKYFDKSKKKKKRNTAVGNQTKKKKIDKIASFERKTINNTSSENSQNQGVRMGLSSSGEGAGLGGTGTADPIFSGYFIRFKNKISRYWHKVPTPNKQDKKLTIIKFKIFRNGSIDDIQIEKSSGNAFNDRAALRAIKGASPFERLPYQYNLNYLLIHFEFIWE